MANLTKAQLRNRVLQHLGVLAAGQSATAEDADLVDEAIDAAWAKLRKFGLMPFATSAIPEWAQQGLRDYVAAEVSPSFGIQGDHETAKLLAERELGKQVAGYRHPIQIRTDYF